MIIFFILYALIKLKLFLFVFWIEKRMDLIAIWSIIITFYAAISLLVAKIIVYFILILRVIYTFRTFLARMRRQSNFKKTASKNENNITKFIIISGVLYVLCSINFIAVVTINRLDVFKKYYYDFFAVLIRFGYFFLAPLILIFNAVIVFFYDRNLRHIFVTNT